mmetsp:Transcript_8872/g.19542  ORF Transcript_8872/g.19542 Transcript_8872/m.19542 type:complete len:208 (-) Transcript_8872:565-1188(-)
MCSFHILPTLLSSFTEAKNLYRKYFSETAYCQVRQKNIRHRPPGYESQLVSMPSFSQTKPKAVLEPCQNSNRRRRAPRRLRRRPQPPPAAPIDRLLRGLPLGQQLLDVLLQIQGRHRRPGAFCGRSLVVDQELGEVPLDDLGSVLRGQLFLKEHKDLTRVRTVDVGLFEKVNALGGELEPRGEFQNLFVIACRRRGRGENATPDTCP